MLGAWGNLLRAIADGPDPASLPAPMEVIPTIELGRAMIDWRFPAQVYSYAGTGVEGSLAANYSHVALSNPVGSGVIAVVEVLTMSIPTNTASCRVATAADVAAFDTDRNEYARDFRILYRLGGQTLGRPPTCQILTDQTIAYVGQPFADLLPKACDAAARYYYTEKDIYVLGPNTALITAPNAVNNANYTDFRWFERRYDPEEIRGMDPRALG